MALTTSKTDRDFNKFRDAGGTDTKVAVTVEQDAGNPIPVSVINQDETITAGESISAAKVIYLDTGFAYLADSNSEIEATAYGISITGAVASSNIIVKKSGPIYDSSFTLTVGEPVFLSTLGGVTQVSPTSGYRVLLGYAIAVNGININIQEKILL